MIFWKIEIVIAYCTVFQKEIDGKIYTFKLDITTKNNYNEEFSKQDL